MRAIVRLAAVVTACAALACGSGASPMLAQAAGDSGPVGGVVLDGFGGLHAFGAFPLRTAGAPYWRDWDIARGMAVLPDGSGGWTLDGFGGIHAWGAAPPVPAPAYWRGWDIARALVVLPDHRSGYVLDGAGGLHAFGPDAPASLADAAPYWPGQDTARGVDVHVNASGIADGAMVLDAWGGLHAFGNYVRQGSLPYFPGHDVYRQLHSVDGKQYGYARFGVTTGIGPGISPYWTGLPSWSGWDIQRDIALFGSNNPTWQAEPLDPYDWNEYLAASGQPSDVGYRPECAVGPGARSSATQVIAVSIECQAMTVYQSGRVLWDGLVTTGRPSMPTPRGWFHILWKRSPWYVDMNFPAGPVRQVAFAMAFRDGGFLFHDAAWEPVDEYGQLGTLLTANASHGCIHVQRPLLDWMYSWAAVGATVDIN